MGSRHVPALQAEIDAQLADTANPTGLPDGVMAQAVTPAKAPIQPEDNGSDKMIAPPSRRRRRKLTVADDG